MHIKQIVIQGFKSYREQTVTEPFDPGHNVVVGRNGSGKSNFFHAIQFVLSDEFSHLRPEQRQALLHEGTGPRVISAFVEIIFDNSDQRLPIDKDEVFIRRVIGSKKDQYFLNKKMVTRTDIMNLLESAGFSRSNPYYIVKQGKINQMATSPDSYRLKLLREVAGTRVYDERREESMVILRETEGKRDKIEEFLKTIMERLATLEEEKEELKEYQKWDRMRRCLEYAIHDRELKDTRAKLDAMENQRKDSGSEQEKMREQMVEAGEQAKVAAKEVRECKSKLTAAKEERDQFNTEYQQLLKDKTKLEFQIKDLVDEVSGDNKSRERAEKELAKLKETIAQKEEEFQQLKPQYEELKRKEDECTRELALKEQKRKELYAKQGRGNQFTSKDERDTWIRKELKSLNKAIRDKKDQIERLTEDLKNDGEKTVQLEKRTEEVTADMETHRTSIDDHNKGYYEMKKKKDALQTERNDLWRQENKVQQEMATLKEDMAKAEQSLRSMVGKPVLNGRDSVMKVLESFKQRANGPFARLPEQYFGLVIENFDCDKSIYTAVEVTAGNRLFFHIVDSDQVGTQILKEMNRQKLPGEANFMPLNKLLVKEIDYPQTQDALPMISKLNFDEKFEKAFMYIFGRNLICRNLEVATSLARSTRLDCVTLDGDQVSSKGSLTGGYFNKSRSRLEIQKTRSDLLTQVKEAEENLGGLRTKLTEVEGSINQIVSDMQKMETKNSKAKDFFDRMKTDVRLMREELTNIERCKGPKERSLNQLKASLEGMQTTQEGLESELHQELLPQLSASDQREVDRLNDEIRSLTQANKAAFTQRMKLEAEKNKLENLLQNNLNRRKDELMLALQEISVEDRKQQLENCTSELKTVETSVENVQSQLKGLDKKLQEFSKKHKAAQSELDKWKSKEKELMSKMESDARELEKMASKQTLYQDKIAECTRKIRDLGSLPSEAFTKYQNLTTKQLFKQLDKANTELKKYGHVNKKALDQFVSFSEQKETLLARKEELDRAHESIQQLMQTLEQRKFEAIQFTYKQVSKYFGEVFKLLVPQGSGQLVMRTASKNKDKDDEDEAEESFDNFTGVGIRVSFVGTRGEMREMNQLSGGQKSLVALALIFAIQKCDPAPFYLFDEIDQALDAQHRKGVAEMIHELSKNAQFITTTFRPELLEHARKFYGVKFRNKVSHIECVTKEEAADFVEDDTQHA